MTDSNVHLFYILMNVFGGIAIICIVLGGWWTVKQAAWKITRYNFCGFEVERYNRITREWQHRHYTDNTWSWKSGKNPYRDEASKNQIYEFDA